MRLMSGLRVAASVALWALTGTPVDASEIQPLKLERLDLAIKVFPVQKRIEGDATLRFAALARIDSLQLDLHSGFHVAEVSVDGRRVGWKHAESGEIRIQLPAPAAARKTFA
ncbi:MAG TPA: hypothetical protein VIL32_04640, partial [Steroidobacteraceae bacterium]